MAVDMEMFSAPLKTAATIDGVCAWGDLFCFQNYYELQHEASYVCVSVIELCADNDKELTYRPLSATETKMINRTNTHTLTLPQHSK